MRRIQKKSSTTTAIPTALAAGEIAVNTADSKLFIEDDAGVMSTHDAWFPALYEVADLTARDLLVTSGDILEGQYCRYHNGTTSQLDMWSNGSWWIIDNPSLISI